MATSQEDIESFLAFTGIYDRSLAQTYLAHNSYNLENAVGAWYEAGDNAATKYADAPPTDWAQQQGRFIGPRVPAQSQLDEMPASDAMHSLAATRPNSRVGQHWENDQTMGTLPAGNEDADMQRAMQESMSFVAPYLPDPMPEERQRDPDIVPAFLKPLPSAQPDFLPSLFTILHSVPAFQSAIMDHQAPEYGQNPSWWKENTSRDMGLVECEINEMDQRLALLHESQRLAAFLDGSKRLYGSAASLAAILSSMSGSMPLGTNYLKALDEALAAHEKDLLLSRGSLFHSRYTKPVSEDDTFCMMLHPPGPDTVPQESLYDALDEYLYSEGSLFAHTAPIIAINLSKRPPLHVPHDLLLDRYHSVNEDKIQRLIHQRSEKSQQYLELWSQNHKLETFARPGRGSGGDARKLMKAALDLLDKRASYMMQAGRKRESDKDTLYSALDKIRESLESRKTSLDAERADTLQDLRRLRDLKTTPADVEESQHRFALVGFAKAFDTTTQETHFTKSGSWWRARYQTHSPVASVQVVEGGPSATEQPMAEDVDCAVGTTQGTSQATPTHPQIAAVLEEAGRLDADTLLIYADTKVLAEEHNPALPHALKTFIETDNAHFESEIGTSSYQDGEGRDPRDFEMADVSNDHAQGYEHAAPPDWNQDTNMHQFDDEWARVEHIEQSSNDADEGLAFPPHIPPHLPPRPKRRSVSDEGFVEGQSPSKASKAYSDSSQGP